MFNRVIVLLGLCSSSAWVGEDAGAMTTLVIIASGANEPGANEFLVLRCEQKEIVWQYNCAKGFSSRGIIPEGEVRQEGRILGSDANLRDAFRATCAEIIEKEAAPRSANLRSPSSFSMLLIHADQVQTCQLWSGDQRRRLVRGPELAGLFNDVRKKVFGYGSKMSDLLTVGDNVSLAEPIVPRQGGPNWEVPKFRKPADGEAPLPRVDAPETPAPIEPFFRRDP